MLAVKRLQKTHNQIMKHLKSGSCLFKLKHSNITNPTRIVPKLFPKMRGFVCVCVRSIISSQWSIREKEGSTTKTCVCVCVCVSNRVRTKHNNGINSGIAQHSKEMSNKTLEMRSSVSAKGVWQCLQL